MRDSKGKILSEEQRRQARYVLGCMRIADKIHYGPGLEGHKRLLREALRYIGGVSFEREPMYSLMQNIVNLLNKQALNIRVVEKAEEDPLHTHASYEASERELQIYSDKIKDNKESIKDLASSILHEAVHVIADNIKNKNPLIYEDIFSTKKIPEFDQVFGKELFGDFGKIASEKVEEYFFEEFNKTFREEFDKIISEAIYPPDSLEKLSPEKINQLVSEIFSLEDNEKSDPVPVSYTVPEEPALEIEIKPEVREKLLTNSNNLFMYGQKGLEEEHLAFLMESIFLERGFNTVERTSNNFLKHLPMTSEKINTLIEEMKSLIQTDENKEKHTDDVKKTGREGMDPPFPGKTDNPSLPQENKRQSVAQTPFHFSFSPETRTKVPYGKGVQIEPTEQVENEGQSSEPSTQPGIK